MTNTFFTLIIFLGALICMQNGNASVLPWWDMTAQEVRERIDQRIMSIEAPAPAVFSVVDHHITQQDRTTPIRIYTPSKEGHFPVILFIHGGAWVGGSLDTHDNLARYLCSESKAIVVSVGYLNAPEGKFPLPLEQCYDTLTWIIEQGSAFSIDTTRLAVVGDSAGGNMSAALCLMARDRSGPKIDLQVLINPSPDLTCNGTILRQDDSVDMLRWIVIQYLSDLNEVNNPYVSPSIANDLSGLPPAVVILAEEDAVRESGQKYADRLQAANVPTYVYCQQGVNHLAGHGARASDYAKESLEVAAAQIRHAFLIK